MSVNSMTNAAIGRRLDFPPLGDVPHHPREIAASASNGSTPSNLVTDTLAVITTYIPTEVLTVYVAALAAVQNSGSLTSFAMWTTFDIFLIATPIIVWLVYVAKIKSAGKPLPWAFAQWPLWEMIAGTLAFVAWAISLPSAPFLTYLGLPGTLATVILLITTTLLGLLALLFQNPIKPA